MHLSLGTRLDLYEVVAPIVGVRADTPSRSSSASARARCAGGYYFLLLIDR